MIVELPRLPTTLLLIAISLFFWFTTINIYNQPQQAIIDQLHIHQHHLTLHDHYKALAQPLKFNFSLFVSRRHHHRKFGHGHLVARSEIDPRYGVEMHLVPTGPNPLHH